MFGLVGTLQNVAVISSMQKVPVVGACDGACWPPRVLSCCWPFEVTTCSRALDVATCAAAGDPARRRAAIPTSCHSGAAARFICAAADVMGAMVCHAFGCAMPLVVPCLFLRPVTQLPPTSCTINHSAKLIKRPSDSIKRPSVKPPSAAASLSSFIASARAGCRERSIRNQ